MSILRVCTCCVDDRDIDVPSQSLLPPAQQNTHSVERSAPTEDGSAPAPTAAPATARSPSAAPKGDPLAGTVPASSTVDSLESYNAMLGSLASAGEIARPASVAAEDLNVEVCAVCCSDIVLGPQSAIKLMSIPPGDAPRHFDCGHVLHADCFAVYICSHGHACPICKLDPSRGADSPEQRSVARGGAGCDGAAGTDAGAGGAGAEGGEERDDSELGEDEWALQEERDVQASIAASLRAEV